MASHRRAVWACPEQMASRCRVEVVATGRSWLALPRCRMERAVTRSSWLGLPRCRSAWVSAPPTCPEQAVGLGSRLSHPQRVTRLPQPTTQAGCRGGALLGSRSTPGATVDVCDPTRSARVARHGARLERQHSLAAAGWRPHPTLHHSGDTNQRNTESTICSSWPERSGPAIHPATGPRRVTRAVDRL